MLQASLAMTLTVQAQRARAQARAAAAGADPRPTAPVLRIGLLTLGFAGDPLKARVVTSLARPGGNITGLTLLIPPSLLLRADRVIA